MTYEDYIASPVWARLRSEALIRDSFRCRGCGATDRLEVHHVRYDDPLGYESVEDMTTLCGGSNGCHHAITESIRRRRYGERRHVVAPVERLTPGNCKAVHVLKAFEV